MSASFVGVAAKRTADSESTAGPATPKACAMCGTATGCSCAASWSSMVTELKQLGVRPSAEGSLLSSSFLQPSSGQRVRLHGLDKTPEFNECVGFIVGTDPETKDFNVKVQFEGEAVNVSVPATNLKAEGGEPRGEESRVMAHRLAVRCAGCGRRPGAGHSWARCQRCQGPRYCTKSCQALCWKNGERRDSNAATVPRTPLLQQVPGPVPEEGQRRESVATNTRDSHTRN